MEPDSDKIYTSTTSTTSSKDGKYDSSYDETTSLLIEGARSTGTADAHTHTDGTTTQGHHVHDDEEEDYIDYCDSYEDDDASSHENDDGNDDDANNLNLKLHDTRRSLSNEEESDSYSENNKHKLLSAWTMICILSTAFAYGCVMTTLFLITLPIECDRIEKNTGIPKSVALGCFVAISGFTQLISPFAGMLSDTYRPPSQFQLGQRMPFLSFGAILSVLGLLGEYINSYHKLWIPYAFFFFFHMIGLNVTYAMMIALIPDQVPYEQTGKANGVLALLLVTGSLTGFGLFHFCFNGQIQDMYGLYICIVILTTIMTSLYAHDQDVRLLIEKLEISESRRRSALRKLRRHDDLKKSTKNRNNKYSEMTKSQRRRRRRRLLLGPYSLLKTMFYDPIILMDKTTLIATYTIDRKEHKDFFVVTISRLFYYCGSSVQTFFLYFIHDIIRDVKDDPEAAVATLAVIAQISGALFCYPIGQLSDQYFDGKRKPFVYASCTFLGAISLSIIFARTMNQMAILCFLQGAANGSYLTIETSLAIDTLPPKNNYNDDGPGNAQLLGIWGVAAFLGSALGPMIGGPLLYIFGSSSSGGTTTKNDNIDDQQDYTIEGYTVVLSLSALYFIFSALCLRWVKKPNV